MPFIPVPNVAQAELVYLWNGQVCENVLHFEYATSPGAPELTNLANNLITWWNAGPALYISDSVELEKVICTDLTAQNAEAVEVASGALGQVTFATSPTLPNNVTVAVKKVTGLRGRSYRGRLYQVGLTENVVGNNQVDATYSANLRTVYNQLLTYAWTDPGWIYVVVSRFTNNLPRSTGVTTPIIDHSVDSVVDSQRRRLPGRGQ